MGTSKTGHINPNSPQTSHNCDRPTSASENQSTMPPTASDNVNNHNNDTYQHPDDCFVEVLGSRDGQMVVLSRRLPSGRMIHIDTMDGAMLNGGVGLAHLNMDNSNFNDNIGFYGGAISSVGNSTLVATVERIA